MSTSIIASILAASTNSYLTTSAQMNGMPTDFISQGVVGTIGLNSGSGGTGAFAVNAQGTPAMFVDVVAGMAWITATPTGEVSQRLRAYMASSYTSYAISANSSGSTKYDWIYLKVDPDKAATPASDGSDAITLYTSRSSSNTTDNGTPPTYGILLAVVTVANGASSISNSNIADKRIVATYRSTPATSEVNFVDIQSAATGNAPTISATGDDTNVGLNLVTKGTGQLQYNGNLGLCVQEVGNVTGAVATGTTTIPFDDTIPQNTEGDQILSQAITPRASTNILEITCNIMCSYSVTAQIIVVLFQDSTANALAATAQYMTTATGRINVTLIHRMVAGTTSATTFKIRIGSDTAGTWTLNGSAGARRFGGVSASSLTIKEYEA